MLWGELNRKEIQKSWLQWQQERGLSPGLGDDSVRLQPPQLIKAHRGARQDLGTAWATRHLWGPLSPQPPHRCSGLQVTRGDENSLTPQNQDPEKRASMLGRPSRVPGSPGWSSPSCSRYREHSRRGTQTRDRRGPWRGAGGPSSQRRLGWEAERRGCCEWYPGWRHRTQHHHPLTVPQAGIHLLGAAPALGEEGHGWAGRRYSPRWAGGSSHPLGQKRETAGWGCCPSPSPSHTPRGRRASREPGPAPEGGSGRW